MKKLITFLFLSLFSLYLFSKDFSLFPWFCNQKDIYTQCINKGWTYQSSPDNSVSMFIFHPTKDVTYNGYPVEVVGFFFDENGIVTDQLITIPEIDDTLLVLSMVLDFMTTDKIQIIDKELDHDTKTNYTQITYKGIMKNNIKVYYTIHSKENNCQLTIMYFKDK